MNGHSNLKLVIISSLSGPKLTDSFIGDLLAPIPSEHRSSSVNWLSPNKAFELDLFTWNGGGEATRWDSDPDMYAYVNSRVVTTAKLNHKLDAALIPTKSRRKKLLVADMDSTIIEQECIDEIAEFAGRREEIADITERAMRGELDFEAALKERVSMLAGLPVAALQDAFENQISVTPGAKELVATMNRAGAVTALVSGGFTFFTSRIAKLVGFQYNQANELVIVNDALTGAVASPILGHAAKQNALLQLAGEYNIPIERTLAVGDGANDLSMLERSGLGVAFHAKPAVAESADARIDHADLTALLYLQGYRETEIWS